MHVSLSLSHDDGRSILGSSAPASSLKQLQTTGAYPPCPPIRARIRLLGPHFATNLLFLQSQSSSLSGTFSVLKTASDVSLNSTSSDSLAYASLSTAI